LTLLAFGLLAPGSARASGCVHDRPMASHFEGLIHAGAMSESHDAAPSTSSHRANPGRVPTCSGPLCSQGPAAPSSSPWVAPEIHDSWALMAGRLDPSARGSRPLAPEATPLLPSQRGPSVFHPPRVATN